MDPSRGPALGDPELIGPGTQLPLPGLGRPGLWGPRGASSRWQFLVPQRVEAAGSSPVPAAASRPTCLPFAEGRGGGGGAIRVCGAGTSGERHHPVVRRRLFEGEMVRVCLFGVVVSEALGRRSACPLAAAGRPLPTPSSLLSARLSQGPQPGQRPSPASLGSRRHQGLSVSFSF